jgi:hypothetical protein
MRQSDVTLLGILIIWWLAAKYLWTELKAVGWIGLLAHLGTVGVFWGLFDATIMLCIYTAVVFMVTQGWVELVTLAYWFVGGSA